MRWNLSVASFAFPWWLNLFSYLDWLFVLPLRTFCSVHLPIYWQDALFFRHLIVFFIDINLFSNVELTSFLSHPAGRLFSLFVLSFAPPKSLNLMQSHLPVVALLPGPLESFSERSYLCPYLETVPSSCLGFQVLYHGLHFTLTFFFFFLYMKRERYVLFFSCTCGYPVPWTPFIGNCLFSRLCFWQLCRQLDGCSSVGLFLASLFCSVYGVLGITLLVLLLCPMIWNWVLWQL